MSRTGYVLAGGNSVRMGRDKALLPWGGVPLAAHVADLVRQAAGSVALVGDPSRFQSLGFEVVPDRLPGLGPLSGIHAALHRSAAEWNLVTACDMPGLSVPLLAGMLDAARAAEADVLFAAGSDNRPEPLCGVWRSTALAAVEAALAARAYKVADVAQNLKLILWPVAQSSHFTNLNTPEDWAAYAPR